MRRLLPLTALLAASGVSAETFIDLGIHSSKIESKIANRDDTIDRTDSGVHIGVGARRSVTESSDLSVRLEAERIDSHTFFAIRAFDYRYHFSNKLALTAFFGAGRLDLSTPAYGYYFGGGVQWKSVLPDWDLSLDVRFGDKVARDNLLPNDPQGGSPDNFHDISGFSLYLSYRF